VPIDPGFRKKREKAGEEKGIAIWGPVNPPERLGIRGTIVAVDWDICEGCGICVEICPVKLFEWREASGHPTSPRKPLPAREPDCVQCFRCERECPAGAIRITYGGSVLENAILSLMFAQIMVGIGYGTIFGPYLGIRFALYAGWVLSLVSLPFWFSTLIYFPRKGEPQEGKRFVDTTVLVDSGIYSLVRHPQFLGCIMLMSASILVSQHWLAAIVGIPISVWLYREIPKEEEGSMIRFGDDYKHYAERVPKLNPFVGALRLLQRRQERDT
jgi:NAD-dependent dihydropyrimidine dehydrogenase PreA subunit